MVVRLLMHPVAENVFICLSVGLILFSAGLIGSVLWMPPRTDEATHLVAQVSVAAVGATPVSVLANSTAPPCVQHSGFAARATLAECVR
jgi:hypothetical protein